MRSFTFFSLLRVALPAISSVMETFERLERELQDARDELGYADVRAKNADGRLYEALRHLGTGDNNSAHRQVKAARAFLAGGEPAE